MFILAYVLQVNADLYEAYYSGELLTQLATTMGTTSAVDMMVVPATQVQASFKLTPELVVKFVSNNLISSNTTADIALLSRLASGNSAEERDALFSQYKNMLLAHIEVRHALRNYVCTVYRHSAHVVGQEMQENRISASVMASPLEPPHLCFSCVSGQTCVLGNLDPARLER